MKYQLFVINIINLLGALYLISISLLLILISKLVPLTPETVKTLNMFIRLRDMVLMIGMLFSLLMQLEFIIYGHVRKCVRLSPFS